MTPLEPDSSGGGGGSGLSIPQYALLSIIVGLVIEISFTGIITITLRVLRKESKNFWKMACLMVFFNVWCIVYMVFFTLSYFAVKENCVLINSSSNVSSHLFYVSYDVFMLYKTYAVSKCSKLVLAIIVLLLANRAVWSIWDIAKSTGVYDAETDVCAYYQYPLSGFGYNTADLIIDAFCTIVSLVANWAYLFTSFGQLGEVIVKENILRSVLVLSVNSYLMYVNLHVQDLMTILVAYMLQNYTYTRAVNAELFWVEERRNVMQSSVDNGAGTGSGGRSEMSTNATFTSTTNTTVAAAKNSGSGGGSGLSMVQYAFLSIIVGLVIEISFTGIIAITMRLFKKEGSNNFWKVGSIMLFFNVWCIIYMVFFTLSSFAVKENCVMLNTMSNISSHLFYVSYDVFMLYKTYAVSKRNRVVLYCIFVIVAHRAVWTGWDIAKSTGVYDPETDICAYYQYPLSG
ncbi:hypothetical protein HDU77_000758, partial [Chytriomyces hyalinus]